MTGQLDPRAGDPVAERVREYIRAVEAGDLEALESFYADDFENIRFDHHGQSVRLERRTFLGLLSKWQDTGSHPLPPATSTTLHPTSYFPGYAASTLTRVKGGQSLAYVLIWQETHRGWLLLREFTIHEALPPPPGE